VSWLQAPLRPSCCSWDHPSGLCQPGLSQPDHSCELQNGLPSTSQTSAKLIRHAKGLPSSCVVPGLSARRHRLLPQAHRMIIDTPRLPAGSLIRWYFNLSAGGRTDPRPLDTWGTRSAVDLAVSQPLPGDMGWNAEVVCDPGKRSAASPTAQGCGTGSTGERLGTRRPLRAVRGVEDLLDPARSAVGSSPPAYGSLHPRRPQIPHAGTQSKPSRSSGDSSRMKPETDRSRSSGLRGSERLRPPSGPGG
jgi:hypothetical protein